MSIDHVGIAVSDLDAALSLWKKVLDFGEVRTVDMPHEGVKVAMLHLGDTKIELLQPIGDGGPVGKFLEKRGEGVHHLAVRVKDVKRGIERAKENGIELVDLEPRKGAYGYLAAFVHPRAMRGVLLELVQY